MLKKYVSVGVYYVKSYNIDAGTDKIEIELTNVFEEAMDIKPEIATSMAMSLGGEVVDGYPN